MLHTSVGVAGARKPPRKPLYIIILSTVLMALDVVDLIVVMPGIHHHCTWPHEVQYGGYQHTLFVGMVLSAVVDMFLLGIISFWYAATTGAAGPLRVDRHRLSATTDVHIQQRGFWLWRSCGFHRTDRLPCGIDFMLVTSLFTQCVVLAYHHTFLLAITLVKCACILLLLVRDDDPRNVKPQLTRPEHFVSQTRIAALAAVVLVALFVFLFGLQYAETFASGHAYYRSAQLRQMNNDRDAFNRPLLFHEWLGNHSAALSRGHLDLSRRVVLVVIDGCRYDAMQNNPAMRQLWGERASDTWMTEMQSALPTMSAPNWMTLLTGSQPEVTGLHGNIFPGETEFSTMMDMMARLATSHTDFLWGMTGCLWWSDMVKTRFPRMSGDGAVSSYSMYDVLRRHQDLPLDLELSVSEQLVRPPYLDFQEYSSIDGLSDDITDQHRTNIACDALNRTTEPFRFFLVHLTNVDTQAHYFGVQSPRYNHDDTYQHAVTRTAGFLRQILGVVGACSPMGRYFLISSRDTGAP